MIAGDSGESLDAIFGLVEDQVTVQLFSPDSLVFPVGNPSSLPAEEAPGKRLRRAYEDSDADAILDILEGVMAGAAPETLIASTGRWIRALLEMDRLASPITAELIGEIASPRGAAGRAFVMATPNRERGAEAFSSPESPAVETFRVDPSIVDSLNHLVGELIIAKNNLARPKERALRPHGAPGLAEEIQRSRDAIDGVVEKLQYNVARMKEMVG